MQQLHYYPSTASMAPHILLEEIGAPFELLLVERDLAGHKSADYLRLNPNGTIPAYVDGDLVLYESAAICLHLGDTAPAGQWLPAPGTAQRAHGYKWLIWMTNTLQAALMVYFYPERWTREGDDDAAQAIKARAEAKVGLLLQQLETELARHGGPWLLGGSYSVLDPFCLMLCRWTRGFSTALPARGYTHLGVYLQRMLERPAVQRALATEQLAQPWV